MPSRSSRAEPSSEPDRLPEAFWGVEYDDFITAGCHQVLPSCIVFKRRHWKLIRRLGVVDRHLKGEISGKLAPHSALYDNEADARKIGQHLKEAGKTNVKVREIKTKDYYRPSFFRVLYDDGYIETGLRVYQTVGCRLVFSVRAATQHLYIDPELAAQHGTTWVSSFGFPEEVGRNFYKVKGKLTEMTKEEIERDEAKAAAEAESKARAEAEAKAKAEAKDRTLAEVEAAAKAKAEEDKAIAEVEAEAKAYVRALREAEAAREASS